MKEHSLATSVSLLFHIIVVALFLRVPFDQYIRPKLMVLDFSLEKGRVIGDGEDRKTEDGNRESGIVNRESKIEDRELQHRGEMTDHRNRPIEQEDNVQRGAAAELSGGLNAVASDPAGQVTVRGETGPIGVKADDASGKHIFVSGDARNLLPTAGGRRVIDYGTGGSGVKDFPFIADTINRRFRDRYPDRARRMGWEGEVRVSFVISEDGAVYDVEVVNSSGRNIFDDHAREILAKTTFNRRLPYPLKIENCPVTYKLQ